MLAYILIKQFVNGLSNEESQERVILKALKTLPEAAQFARFEESVVRVARNHSPAESISSTVSSLSFRGRGSSSGPSKFTSRGREQSTTGFGSCRGRGRGRSVGRGAFKSELRASSSGPKFGQGQQQNSRDIKCFNCQQLGHYERDCRSGSGFGHGRDTSGNWRECRPQSRPYSNIKPRISTVGRVIDQGVIEEEGDVAEASGYRANCISSADAKGHEKLSALHLSRKLLAVPSVINGLQYPNLLVDCGSPVTLIRPDMWEQVKQLTNKLLVEEKQFQGVIRDGLRVIGVAHLKLEFWSLHIEHPVVVVDKIAYKFILGNDFLIAHRCDILNSDGTIVFGCKSVPYTLFRSIINLICPVICQAQTEIEPYEEEIIPGLLDFYRSYDPNQTLLLEPR